MIHLNGKLNNTVIILQEQRGRWWLACSGAGDSDAGAHMTEQRDIPSARTSCMSTCVSMGKTASALESRSSSSSSRLR